MNMEEATLVVYSPTPKYKCLELSLSDDNTIITLLANNYQISQ